MPILQHDPLINEASALFLEFKETKRALLLDAKRSLSSEQFEQLANLVREDDWRELHNLAKTLTEHLALNANALTDIALQLRQLQQNEVATAKINRALAFRAKALREAIRLHQQIDRQRRSTLFIKQIFNQVGNSKRLLTTAETQKIEQLRVLQSESNTDLINNALSETKNDGHDSQEFKEAVVQILATLRIRAAHRELSQGLLLTPQMSGIIDDALPIISRGEPMLLIGETGGAKTALAEYLADKRHPSGHEFISGFGDISSTQVIGAHELRVENGATVSIFVPGPLLRAMENGTPIILDEINAMPPEFLKRLNRILQLVPGEVYRVQENAGRPVTVAPGFVILATANEQSSERYRGIFSLSSELTNRFGAGTFRVLYPDADSDFTDVPGENLLLVTIALSNSRGELPRHVSSNEIEAVARFAFISQQVFAGRYGEGFDEFISDEQRIDSRPGLEQSVFAPRTLVKLLNNVRDSGGSLSINHALSRFVSGVMNSEDRAVLTHMMRAQGFY